MKNLCAFEYNTSHRFLKIYFTFSDDSQFEFAIVQVVPSSAIIYDSFMDAQDCWQGYNINAGGFETKVDSLRTILRR